MCSSDLREMATVDSAAFISKVSRYVANIPGTYAYWHKVKEDVAKGLKLVLPEVIFYRIIAFNISF